MKIKTITVNGLVAALYIAITALVQPIAFNAVQFRVSEVFNHLVVFQKKYFFGIVLGVFFANLFFSPIKLFDLTFGVLHSALSLGITILLCRFINNVWVRMIANSVVFSVMMFIIAIELNLAFGDFFWEAYLYCFIGEIVVMLIGMPLMYFINKRLHFEKLFD